MISFMFSSLWENNLSKNGLGNGGGGAKAKSLYQPYCYALIDISLFLNSLLFYFWLAKYGGQTPCPLFPRSWVG